MAEGPVFLILFLSFLISWTALYQFFLYRGSRIQDGAPIQVAVFQTVDEHFGGGDVGGHRDVMYVAQAQQVHLVGFTGLGGDGVAEEEEHVHLVAGDARRDLLVTAVFPRHEALYIQPGGFGHQPPGGPGGDQPVRRQNAAIRDAELNHQFLFGIVCNQCNRHNKPRFPHASGMMNNI